MNQAICDPTERRNISTMKEWVHDIQDLIQDEDWICDDHLLPIDSWSVVVAGEDKSIRAKLMCAKDVHQVPDLVVALRALWDTYRYNFRTIRLRQKSFTNEKNLGMTRIEMILFAVNRDVHPTVTVRRPML